MNALHWFWSRSNLKERGQEIRQFDENIAPRAGRDCLWPTDDQGHMRAPVGHRHLPPLILVQFYGGEVMHRGFVKRLWISENALFTTPVHCMVGRLLLLRR